MVVFWQNWLYSGKVVVFGQKLFLSGKSGCIRQSRCNRANVVVMGENCVYSGKVTVFV